MTKASQGKTLLGKSKKVVHQAGKQGRKKGRYEGPHGENNTVVGSSLPPLVTGQLRCFLYVQVNWIRWYPPFAVASAQVKVQWWGESKESVLLSPKVITGKSQKELVNAVRYPVRCGPKEFASYLKDMSTLYLSIVESGSQNQFAQVQISQISKLSAGNPIQGSFPIYSTLEKSRPTTIGEMGLHIAFQSISDAFHVSSASIPTVDTYDQQVQALGSNVGVASTSQTHQMGQADANRAVDEHIAEDQDFSFVVGPGRLLGTRSNQVEKGGNERTNQLTRSHQDMTKTRVLGQQMEEGGLLSSVPRQKVSVGDSDQHDLLSALIQRGQSLREKMILSTAQSHVKTRGITLAYQQKATPQNQGFGKLLKHILEDSEASQAAGEIGDLKEVKGFEQELDQKAIDLCLGEEPSLSQLLHREDISASFSDYSEHDDPLHDSGLLQELFYAKVSPQLEETMDRVSDDKMRKKERSQPNLQERVAQRPEIKKTPYSSGSQSDGSLDDPGNIRPQRKVQSDFATRVASSPGKRLEPGLGIARDTERCESSRQPSSDIVPFSNLTSRVPEGMTLDLLTMLGRVQFARVVISDLILKVGQESIDLGTRTYFVEYSFPIGLGEEDGHAVASEVVRVASRKWKDGVVPFNHRSVFPVVFNGQVIEKWWKKALAFKVFCRHQGERTPVAIGCGVLPLRRVLQASSLSFSVPVAVKAVAMDPPTARGGVDQGIDKGSDTVAELSVVVELVGSKPRSSAGSASADSELAPSSPSQDMVSDDTPPTPRKSILVRNKGPVAASFTGGSLTNSQFTQQCETQESALEGLLYVVEGKGIRDVSGGHGNTAGPSMIRTLNIYVVCRMFWCDEVSKSNVNWNTNDPVFRFQVIIPVLLNSLFLQRARNNFMVIEVWSKVMSASNDQLIGIVKLPINQFYLSFRDKKVAQTLLKSKYPVIACDEWKAVINPFFSEERGHLKVVLALGTHDQIAFLLQTIGHSNAARPVEQTPDASPQKRETTASRKANARARIVSVCHTYHIFIKSADNLKLGDRDVWGECDCYVKYFFPDGEKDVNKPSGYLVLTHSTPTALGVPHLNFRYDKQHKIFLPKGHPLQQVLLDAFADPRCHGNVVFELWKRFYYPNVRDSLFAKASLSPAKLCAMSAMTVGEQAPYQSFSLPLRPVDGEDTENSSCGTLNVSFQYQQKKILADESETELRSCQHVCISVSILRACGLKAGAEILRRKYPQAEYASQVGLNTYVRMYPSFLGTESARLSNTVAKSFTPVYSHHVDFPAPVRNLGHSSYLQEGTEDPSFCLAQMLESGMLICEVYHVFTLGSRDTDTDTGLDEMIGLCKIPLAGLLSHHTGIKGWIQLYIPNTNFRFCDEVDSKDVPGSLPEAGGLDFEISFGKASDREMVINVARGLGWSPLDSVDLHDESWISSMSDTGAGQNVAVVIRCARVWFSPKIIETLLPGRVKTDQPLVIYVRYIFYNHGAYCSKSRAVGKRGNLMTCELDDERIYNCQRTKSLAWYLREEKLEVQFWLGGNKGNERRESRDKLLGAAYVDLTPLTERTGLGASVSGLYPLFKPNADYMGKSYARLVVHTERGNKDAGRRRQSLEDGTLSSTYPDDPDVASSFSDSEEKQIAAQKKSEVDGGHKGNGIDAPSAPEPSPSAVPLDVIIEEACHLPLLEVRDSQKVEPDTYVTCQLGDRSSLIITPVEKDNCKPAWNFRATVWLEKVDIQTQELYFKVWFSDSTKDGSRPLKDSLVGVAAVDLSPLMAGLRQINGWYNICDYAGHVKGQLKLAITPSLPLKAREGNYPERLVFPSLGNDQLLLSSLRAAMSANASKDQAVNKCPGSTLSGDAKVPTTCLVDSFEASDTSKSMLLQQLRGNLSELESVTRNLEDRIGTSEKRDWSCSASERTISREPKISCLNSVTVADTSVLPEFGHQYGAFSETERQPTRRSADKDDHFQEIFPNRKSSCDSLNEVPTPLDSSVSTYGPSIIDVEDKNLSNIAYSESLLLSDVESESAEAAVRSSNDPESRQLTFEHLENEDALIERAPHSSEVGGDSPEGNEIRLHTPDALTSRKGQLKDVSSIWKTLRDGEEEIPTPPDSDERHDLRLSDGSPHEELPEEDSFFSLQVPKRIPQLLPKSSDQQSSSSGKEADQTLDLPNFFMPVNELAKSMRKLRLAAQFSASSRTVDSQGHEDSSASAAGTNDDDKFQSLKSKLRIHVADTVPLSDTEVLRRAEILSGTRC